MPIQASHPAISDDDLLDEGSDVLVGIEIVGVFGGEGRFDVPVLVDKLVVGPVSDGVTILWGPAGRKHAWPYPIHAAHSQRKPQPAGGASFGNSRSGGGLPPARSGQTRADSWRARKWEASDGSVVTWFAAMPEREKPGGELG